MERWLTEGYPKIRFQAHREKVESFFEDELGVRSDFHSAPTWVPKGKHQWCTLQGSGLA